MKKLIVCLLLLLFIFPLSGCGGIKKENQRSEDDMVGYIVYKNDDKKIEFQVPKGSVIDFSKGSFVNVYLNEEKQLPYIQVSRHNYKTIEKFIDTYKEGLVKSYKNKNLSDISSSEEQLNDIPFKTLSYTYEENGVKISEKAYIWQNEEKTDVFKIRRDYNENKKEKDNKDKEEDTDEIDALFNYILRNFEIIS